ncbi:outer membrane beta-barrel protein [Candidatus Bandiella numerosa]|uniref:outer membrane beta-barrel protein n=1 Tax=Candidatus Bandiella numerosa TaxID=2570586 RepID=UPI00249E3F1C|nr:outer membrane beta-barrel protein [Candidatus Bandiella numerosa]WHA04318.1 outer membrane beta-barrel protein [Candidatus Bandiella numerosa]
MKKILLTTVAVAAFAQGASALEAGKMYVRADLGYNFSSPKLNEKIANGKDTGAALKGTKQSNRLKGFAGDLGFGYALSDSIRTDVTINMSQGKKNLKNIEFSADTIKLNKIGNTYSVDGKTAVAKSTQNAKLQNTTINLKEKKLGLMANAYYDFNNASELTPYVMAGVGVNRGSLEAKVSGYEQATGDALKAASETIKSKNLTSFAYQVGVGVGYEVVKDITLDVGYKMSGTTGNYKFKASDYAAAAGTTPAGILNALGVTDANNKAGSPKLQHTLTAGVRFAF